MVRACCLHPHAGRNPGTGHQERNAQRRIVKKNAVRVLAVLAEALAMIGQHRDQRLAGRRLLVNRVEQAAQFVVCISDLAVV